MGDEKKPNATVFLENIYQIVYNNNNNKLEADETTVSFSSAGGDVFMVGRDSERVPSTTTVVRLDV